MRRTLVLRGRADSMPPASPAASPTPTPTATPPPTPAPFTPGAGFEISGSAADKASFNAMVGAEMARSPSFKALVEAINAHSAHPTKLDLGRNQAGIFVDGFVGGKMDLTDIEKWPTDPPADHPHAMTQGQNLAHVLSEAHQKALGQAYAAAHATAIGDENRYRHDRGQTSSLRLPPNDVVLGTGGSVVFQFDNGYKEQVGRDAAGTSITGITRNEPPTPTP